MVEKLPVHERFFTFQGEGVYMGRAAFFIRLFGCPVKCPWCDSAGTWHPNHVPKNIDRIHPAALADEAAESGAKICVITGGEPAAHDLTALCGALHGRNMRVHLETSGGFEVKGVIDWMTLSPKHWKHPISYNVQKADEFKFIIEKTEDVNLYRAMIVARGYTGAAPIWLHPEWSQRENISILTRIAGAVKSDSVYRAGWQLHKLYRVDAADSRSKPQVPLGGDPAKGY